MTLAKAPVIALLSALVGSSLACQEDPEGASGEPSGNSDLGGAGGGDGDSADGEGDGDGFVPRCGVDEEPGTELTNLSSEGQGRCAGVSVAEFVSEIRAQNPELAEVTEMHAEVSDGDSVSYYIAFLEEDGGLRAVFQEGRGDCSSGCIDNVFHYFEADASCQPVRVGSYSSLQNYEENCRERSGEPRWGYPVASPTTNDCDPPEAPVLEGTFEIPFTGFHQACSTSGDAEAQSLSGTLELTIRSGDETGEVTVLLGSPSFDVPWPLTMEFSATRDYLQVSLETLWDNTPTMCLESHSLSMSLDLEVCFVGHLIYEEALDRACDGDLCKASLTLDLDLSSLRALLEER